MWMSNRRSSRNPRKGQYPRRARGLQRRSSGYKDLSGRHIAEVAAKLTQRNIPFVVVSGYGSQTLPPRLSRGVHRSQAGQRCRASFRSRAIELQGPWCHPFTTQRCGKNAVRATMRFVRLFAQPCRAKTLQMRLRSTRSKRSRFKQPPEHQANLMASTAMERRKAGTLKSGRSGKKVTSRKQATAIGLSEARQKVEKGAC